MKAVRHILVRFAAFFSILFVMVSCTGLNDTPVSWENIANTIPSNPDYVVAMNPAVKADSVFNRLWGDDVAALIEKGLALDSLKPSHFVVISLGGTVYVTWPLPSPRNINGRIEDWPVASLNNTVDAHTLVSDSASIVISSTQAWVVNNNDGESAVNSLLSAAMNTKAASVQPFVDCIVNTPELITGAVAYNDRYYTLQLSHDTGQLRLDINAYNKHSKREDLLDGLGRLPITSIDEASSLQPFAVVSVTKGTVPPLMKKLAELSDDKEVVEKADKIAGYFNHVEGIVEARWSEGKVEIEMPFDSHKDAETAAKALSESIGKKDDAKVSVKDKKLFVSAPSADGLGKIDVDKTTPRMHTQTENPSAIAFARLDLEHKLPVVLYFELAPQHARLQVDYKDTPQNFAEVILFIKKLVFDTF